MKMNPQEMSNAGTDDLPLNGTTTDVQPGIMREMQLPPEIAGFEAALTKIQKAPQELHQGRWDETKGRALWTAVAGAIAFACSSALFVLLKENDRQTIQDLNGQIITLTKRADGVKTKEEEEQFQKNNDAHKKMFERLDQMRREDNVDRGFWRAHDMLQEREAALAAKKMPLAD